MHFRIHAFFVPIGLFSLSLFLPKTMVAQNRVDELLQQQFPETSQLPVDHDKALDVVRDDFALVDGAAANGNTLYVPDVRGKKLLAYRSTNTEKPWQVLVKEQGSFSGTFFQLGKLYIADGSGGRIAILGEGRKLTTLCKFDEGVRPNDLVVDTDGNVFVTVTKQGEIRKISPTGSESIVGRGLETPNGIILSADGRSLYVSLYKPGTIVKAKIQTSGALGQFQTFATLQPGEKGALADGMCIDRAGNVYCAGAEKVWIWNSAGKLIDSIETPDRPINCTFGGQRSMDLYISTFGGLVRQSMKAYGVSPNPPPIAGDVKVVVNQTYAHAGERPLLFDMVSPNNAQENRPAIVLVHGGGWLHGDKTKFRPIARKLALKGFVVMCVEYRLGHEAAFPAGVRDCNSAIRFLRKNAQTYGVDPTRIAAVGGSAGGHIVGLMGTGHDVAQLQAINSQSSSRPDAVVVMAGPMQIATGSVAERSKRGLVSNATQWLRKSIDDAPQLYQLADAHQKISKDDPPTLFITGSKDNPDRDKLSLEAFKALGIASKQVVHHGASHGHWNRPETMDQVVDDICNFLSQHLK